MYTANMNRETTARAMPPKECQMQDLAIHKNQVNQPNTTTNVNNNSDWPLKQMVKLLMDKTTAYKMSEPG